MLKPHLMPKACLMRHLLWLIALLIMASPLHALELSDDDRAQINAIEGWLAKHQQWRADFIQVNPDGSYQQGKIWLDRPGRLRVEYDETYDMVLIANHGQLQIVEPNRKTISFLPLSSTPLRFLLAGEIDFSSPDIGLSHYAKAGGLVQLGFEDPDNPEQGRLTLEFSLSPLRLERWIVKDALGEQTRIALRTPQFLDNAEKSPADDALYKFYPSFTILDR